MAGFKIPAGPPNPPASVRAAPYPPLSPIRFAMRLLPVVLVLLAPFVYAQTPCDGADGLDFWLGTWDLTWPGGQGGTPEGEAGRGTNTITKALGGCVVHEQFAAENGYAGESVSVQTPQGWRQTWVDNAGGYLLFTETATEDGALALQTAETTNAQRQTVVSRMTWRNVTADALDWHWQRSVDGGRTWTDVWTIRYTRR